jgi:hypothetical protein
VSWFNLISISLSLLWTTVSLSAQGTIQFANSVGDIDAPFFDLDGVTRLAGNNYMAQLLAGTSADSLEPVGNPATFLSGSSAGYFDGGVVSVPTVAPGEVGFFQVGAWHTLGGTITSYSAALTAGVYYGQSAIFTAFTGGYGIPAAPPGVLTGLQSFALIPEPSAWALLAFGAALLTLPALRRRN